MIITLEEFKRDVDLYIARSAIEEIHITDDGRTVAGVSFYPRLDGIGPAYYFSDLSYLNSVLFN